MRLICSSDKIMQYLSKIMKIYVHKLINSALQMLAFARYQESGDAR